MRKLDILKSSIVKNSMWLFILQIANMVLPLLTIPYVTRVLGALGYGEYSIAYNWMTYFQVFVEYGFALGGARKIAISESNDEDNICFSEIIVSRFVLFIISLFTVNIVCLLTKADTGRYQNIMILMLIVFSVVFQANWIFQGKQQMKFITIINVLGRLISVVLILLFVKHSWQIKLYCFFYSITFIFSSFIGLIVAVKRFDLRLVRVSFKEIRCALKINFPLFASAAISRLFGNVGITILGFYAAEEIVGGYSAVYKIPYIMTLLFSPISQALYPHISRKYVSDLNNANKTLKKMGTAIVGIYGVAGVLIIIFRSLIVEKFLGEEYLVYADLILLLIPQMVFGIINNFLGVQTLVASGQQEKYTVCILSSVIVLICLNFCLCPTIAATGTAAAAMISEVTLTILLFFACKKNVWRVQNV